jgi:head-tail adaptor
VTIEAGRLQHRVRFERQTTTDDGHGNALAEWAPIPGLAGVWAGFRPQFGNESLQAGRLEATMRGTLTVRRSTGTAGVTASDRAVFINAPYAGVSCQIRAIVPTPDRALIEFVIETGVAQ